MLPQFLALGVGLWLIFRESSKQDKPDDGMTEDGLPDYSGDKEGIPTPDKPERPDPSETKWTETASWSGEYIAGSNVVWIMQKGIRYQDGRAEYGQEYIVIGDANHHNFLSSNSDRGTTDIKWELTGNPEKRDSKNVVVFATLEAAEARADELASPPDPDDPVQPQPQPEEDDSDSGGGFSFPRQDGFNLGQNVGSYGGL
tara:strand:+ start:5130 stop:5729 length:600 start_codon:yes stop_codon:yes gene_type:complete